MTSWALRLLGIAAAAVTLGVIAVAPASAATVCQVGTTAAFVAPDVLAGSPCPAPSVAGETNNLTIGADATGAVVLTDSNPISDGDGPGGCSVNGTSAVCPGTTTAWFNLGDAKDTALVGGPVPVVQLLGAASGGAGDDKLTGGPADDQITGGDGDDAVAGGDGADTLNGGSGTDAVDGGGGDDLADGADGNDKVAGGTGNDKVAGGAGDDSVTGGDGADGLDGDPSSGICGGSAGSDELSGDAGSDTLCGGNGPASGPDADVLNGGDGTDRAFYPRAAPVAVAIDGIAGDGEIGENDNVKLDVEAVTGGAGGDTLTGNDGANSLDGGGGSDALHGLGGPDVLTDSGDDAGGDALDGGDGDDVLGDAGAGGDSFAGGAGEDLLTAYSGRRNPVAVSLDGAADDGDAGEADNVAADVEDVIGGGGDDTLTGSAADNELMGGAGADSIAGGDGNDGLSGDSGSDTIDGGADRDLIAGGAGSDALKSRDGVTDRVTCGGGTDSAQADGRDEVGGDCEKPDFAPPAAVTIRNVVVTRAGFVVVTITCPDVERVCSGAVIVKTVRRVAHRFVKLGQVNYTRLRGGDTKVIRARISKTDRLTLRRARRVKVRTVVTNVNAVTGDSTSATKLATVTTRGL